LRLLVCSPVELSKKLGGPKVVVELVEELQELGWDCTLLGLPDIFPDYASYQGESYGYIYAERLRDHLRQHAAEYDVVDYDHGFLPYPRTEFPVSTLFVARSVLLGHHFEVISIPGGRDLRSRLWSILRGRREKIRRKRRSQRAHATVMEADLVNVPSDDDKAELVRCGAPAEKVIVIPFGISRSRRPLFDAVSSNPPPRSRR
jgi:hypothetical protein